MGEFWTLPDSPTDPRYAAVLHDIRSEPDVTLARQKFRAICEEDFWFFCRYATSFGKYVISDPAHPRHGGYWCEEPWVFDRCRDIQQATERQETGIFWNWARFMFKTELITGKHSIWLLMKEPTTTIAILTYKVDQTGETMYSGIRDELENNKILHEHWPEILTEETIRKYKNDQLTVARALGPREPSVSIHSLDKMPTSLHVDWIKIDDAVVRESVRTQASIASTTQAMSQVTFLGKDPSMKWWVGTIWDAQDSYIESIQEDRFSRRDWWTPYGEDGQAAGEPVLRSDKFLNQWRKETTEYDWSCQMLGVPIAREKAAFDLEWLKRYRPLPKDERQGKFVYFFLDPAGGKEKSDYTVLYVQGTGADGLRYSLDLHRERYGLNETIDLLFRLVSYWKPETVFVEEFGAAGWIDSIRREQEHRRFRFNVQKLPDAKRSKEERIALLQVPQRRGEIFWPAEGFGHGSKSTGDSRDTFEQFRVDEYRLWSPVPGSVLFDDMLDAVAWSVQPEVRGRLDFPEDFRNESPLAATRAPEVPAGVSAWAM